MTYLTVKDDREVVLNLYIQPKSSRDRIAGLHDGAIKMNITAPPVEGKANNRVIAFLAHLLKIPKSAITINSGHQGRKKRVTISGSAPNHIRRILEPFL
ncbi:MAG: DUF167 family protein [Thermodesulfobacteriota bacterium]